MELHFGLTALELFELFESKVDCPCKDTNKHDSHEVKSATGWQLLRRQSIDLWLDGDCLSHDWLVNRRYDYRQYRLSLLVYCATCHLQVRLLDVVACINQLLVGVDPDIWLCCLQVIDYAILSSVE